MTSDADATAGKLHWSTNCPLRQYGGLVYDATNKCWKVDWSTFPGGENIEWNPADELWNVTDTPPVEISDTAPDFKAEYFWWNSDTGELFLGYKDPSGDRILGISISPWRSRRRMAKMAIQSSFRRILLHQ